MTTLSRPRRSRERPALDLGAEPKAMATLSRSRRSRERPALDLGAEPKAMATLPRPRRSRERHLAVEWSDKVPAIGWNLIRNRGHTTTLHIARPDPSPLHRLFRVSRGLRPLGPSLGREGLGGIEKPFKRLDSKFERMNTIGER